jgi:hypothetical protein
MTPHADVDDSLPGLGPIVHWYDFVSIVIRTPLSEDLGPVTVRRVVLVVVSIVWVLAISKQPRMTVYLSVRRDGIFVISVCGSDGNMSNRGFRTVKLSCDVRISRYTKKEGEKDNASR